MEKIYRNGQLLGYEWDDPVEFIDDVVDLGKHIRR
jgi:hypothetical protein